MKGRYGMTVLMLTAGTAPAASECKPAVGHFEAQVVPPGPCHCPATAPFCTAGRVWGGIQGSYQFAMTGNSPSAALGGLPTPSCSSPARAPFP